MIVTSFRHLLLSTRSPEIDPDVEGASTEGVSGDAATVRETLCSLSEDALQSLFPALGKPRKVLQACRHADLLHPLISTLLLLEEVKRSGGQPDQIATWRRDRWGSRVEQTFVSQRQRFQQASYYQLALPDRGEATELYYQLCNREVDFDSLLDRYVPVKPGKPRRGIFRAVSLQGLPKLLAKKLRKSRPGVPIPPLMLGKAVLLVQLIEWHEPLLDENTRSLLEREVEDQWIQGELQRRLEELDSTPASANLTRLSA